MPDEKGHLTQADFEAALAKRREQTEGVPTDNKQRASAARDAYIRWRMQEIPAVYLCLMPLSYLVDELWAAEALIRRQLKEDALRLTQKFVEDKGAPPAEIAKLLDFKGLSGGEKFAFYKEVELHNANARQARKESGIVTDADRAYEKQVTDYNALRNTTEEGAGDDADNSAADAEIAALNRQDEEDAKGNK